jgi:hypothetical protein
MLTMVYIVYHMHQHYKYFELPSARDLIICSTLHSIDSNYLS